MTFIDIINDVLIRLRESTVGSPNQTPYSQLIAKLVNDTKRQVEDSWNWDALSVTTPVTMIPGTTNYVVTGSGRRQKGVVINNTSGPNQLHNVPIQWIIDQQQLSTTTQYGTVGYYAWSGFNGTDSSIEVFPTPDNADVLQVNMYVPQATLTQNTTEMLVPAEPVILGAYARAIAERGEDGGLASSEAFGLYKSSLSDHIAIESARYVENDCWVAV